MNRRLAVIPILAVLVGVLAATGYGWTRLQWPTGFPTHGAELERYATSLAGATLLVGLLSALLKWQPWASFAVLSAALAVATGNALPWATAVLVLLSATLLGHGVLCLSRAKASAPSWTSALLVGAGIYGTLIAILARKPIHYVWVYVPFLLLPLLLGRRPLAEMLRGGWARRRQPQQPAWTAAAVDALIGGIALVHVAVALLPELGADALAMHLFAGQQLAARHGWVYDIQKYVWAVMPMLADWIFAAGIMVGGETAARLLNVAFLGVVVVLVRDLVDWCRGDATARRWATLVLVSMPLTFTLGSSLFIESVWASFVLAGTLALLRMEATDGSARHAVPAGIFLGFALAAKAVTLTLMPLLLLLLLARPKTWWSAAGARRIALGIGWLVLLGGYPYANAWSKTRNPVFPFFNKLFQSPFYPAENFESASTFSRWLRWDFPYQAAFNPIQFIEGLPGAGGFHWLLVVVPAAVLLVLARQRRALVLLLFALASMAVSFASVAYLRYVFPAFAIACAVAGVALADRQLGTPVRVLVQLAAAAAVALNLLFLGAASLHRDFAFHTLADKTARDEWLELRMPMRRAVSVVNELNKGGTPVAVLASPLLGQLGADALIPNWYNLRFAKLLHDQKTGPQMAKALQEAGVQFLVVDADWPQAGPRELVEGVTEAVATFGPVSVRRWKPEHRFREELLLNPRFESPTGWSFTTEPPRPGRGAVVSVRAPAVQTIAVQPARRYLHVITIACEQPALARQQINWSSAQSVIVKSDIRVFECGPQPATHQVEVVAPPGAALATVFSVGHTDAPVEFTQNSFRR